jgi:hypothetical protein
MKNASFLYTSNLVLFLSPSSLLTLSRSGRTKIKVFVGELFTKSKGYTHISFSLQYTSPPLPFPPNLISCFLKKDYRIEKQKKKDVKFKKKGGKKKTGRQEEQLYTIR